jgi:VWFA-related protein
VAEAMEVVVVNVEVWVHDRDGQPIHGLTAGDFEVLEDGLPVSITHFAEIGAPRPARGPEPSSPPGATPVPAPTVGAPATPAAPEPGHLLIYFDHLHLAPASTRRLAAELRDFLAGQRMPYERVLIVRQGHDLFTEAGLGSTREEVEAALSRVAGSHALGEPDPQHALSRLQAAWDRAREVREPCRVFAIDARVEIATRVAELERNAAVTLESLRTTARLLSTLPGPKTLLFVSESLATRPGADLVRFAQNTCPGERDLAELAHAGDTAQLGQRLLAFAQEANRNRITVYPFQPTGLRASAFLGASQRSLDAPTTAGVDTLLRGVQRDGLLELARQTGGWAVLDRNRFGRELARVGEDMTSYYSLGFSPAHGGDGGDHTLEVRGRGARMRGARLRHRLGYRDRGSQDLLQDGLDGAIAFGVMRNPLAVRLAAGDLGTTDEGRYEMPLHVLVPAAAIAFLPDDGAERATLGVTVRTSDARSREGITVTESFRPRRPPAGSELLDLRMVLQLPEGIHVVAVAVRDEVARESSVVATTLAIHDPGAAAEVPPASGSEGDR